MQPLRLTLEGRYWDSIVYRGRLYLFGLSGDIRTFNWDSLIDSLIVDKSLRLPLDCAFRRSDFLYGPALQTMFGDPEVRALVREKFTRLEQQPIAVAERQLRRHEIDHQDNPFPFPHTASEMYDRRMYVAGPSGVSAANASGRTKHAVSTKVQRLWDAPLLDMAASWGSLAMAAGDDGLYELDLDRVRYEYWDDRRNGPSQVADAPCSECDWAYQSIFASTRSAGYLASYSRPLQGTMRRHWDPTNEEHARIFQRIIPSEELWNESGYSWGVHDKLCLATPDGIRVIKYQPWLPEEGQRIISIGTVQTQPWKGRVVSASTASFGVVVELEHALVVYPSSGNPITLRGEPVSWRAFPRARHYENQLHIVRDDHLEVLSFNHDYLVDQESKQLGYTVFGSSATRRPVLLN